uniref:Protein of uncharacterized function (DUF3795) n=1 Tax=Clostridioides difficile TaxID=1496 RepID=A0A381I5K9_CLODI|nr:Protein of uncharacterised function (DUF3795) [Clostridioides difficile]
MNQDVVSVVTVVQKRTSKLHWLPNYGKPFWGGECKVKTCCESKELNHCGECDTFPCDMLLNKGKDQGFDPMVNIEQCRKWLEETVSN